MNLYVNVLYTSQQPRQVKIGVSVNQAANVRELREILASDTGVDENHMLLTEIHDEGFHRLIIKINRPEESFSLPFFFFPNKSKRDKIKSIKKFFMRI